MVAMVVSSFYAFDFLKNGFMPNFYIYYPNNSNDDDDKKISTSVVFKII